VTTGGLRLTLLRAANAWGFWRSEWRPAQRAAARAGRDLQRVQDHTASMAADALILVCTLRNEAARIPYFLDYYRNLGVGHFLFIDNGSTDGFMDLVAGAPDVSVWRTDASYRDSRFGVHWVNHLLGRHGDGRWCLTVDPDEFLSFPHEGDRSLRDLTDHLRGEGLSTLPCVMLDLYNIQGPGGARYAGGSPLEVCPWFDAEGYRFQASPHYGGYFIQGGVRDRLFFGDAPERAPALNKTPLVRWRRSYAYLHSTHTLAPRRLNQWHVDGAPRLTGLLLHFKFLDTFGAKVREEQTRRQHYEGGREYDRYAGGAPEPVWSSARSRRYTSWRDGVDTGLMTVGRWF